MEYSSRMNAIISLRVDAPLIRRRDISVADDKFDEKKCLSLDLLSDKEITVSLLITNEDIFSMTFSIRD